MTVIPRKGSTDWDPGTRGEGDCCRTPRGGRVGRRDDRSTGRGSRRRRAATEWGACCPARSRGVEPGGLGDGTRMASPPTDGRSHRNSSRTGIRPVGAAESSPTPHPQLTRNILRTVRMPLRRPAGARLQGGMIPVGAPAPRQASHRLLSGVPPGHGTSCATQEQAPGGVGSQEHTTTP